MNGPGGEGGARRAPEGGAGKMQGAPNANGMQGERGGEMRRGGEPAGKAEKNGGNPERAQERKGPGAERAQEQRHPGAAGPRGAEGGRPGGRGRAANISGEQRTRIRTTIRSSIRSQHVEDIRNADFAINVGTVIPTRYHYYPLPPEIVDIVPEYQGYDYIYVNNQIIILDPETREIVYVVE